MTATPQQCVANFKCGAPATEERTAAGVVLHLCATHAAEWDRDEESERRKPSTPRGCRNKPIVSLTLSREALERLDTLARKRGLTRSGAVEQLVRTETTGARRRG